MSYRVKHWTLSGYSPVDQIGLTNEVWPRTTIACYISNHQLRIVSYILINDHKQHNLPEKKRKKKLQCVSKHQRANMRPQVQMQPSKMSSQRDKKKCITNNDRSTNLLHIENGHEVLCAFVHCTRGIYESQNKMYKWTNWTGCIVHTQDIAHYWRVKDHMRDEFEFMCCAKSLNGEPLVHRVLHRISSISTIYLR